MVLQLMSDGQNFPACGEPIKSPASQAQVAFGEIIRSPSPRADSAFGRQSNIHFGIYHQLQMFYNDVKQVAHSHEDRQWDCRFNVQTEEYLETILAAIKSENEKGKFKWIFVSGVEIGTRPYQDDYEVKHVHIGVIFHNRASKSSIIKNWRICEGNGYYLVPRNRNLPYSGWRSHHAKIDTKVDPESLILFEAGELPTETVVRGTALGPEEKKRKIDEILIDMRKMIEDGKVEEAWKKYPRNFITYGERLKAMVSQKRDFFKNKGDPHMWVFGYPGTGKTAVLSFVYPNTYKKNLHNKFFDLYDPTIHDHVMLEDLDHEAVERLSLNFLKTICDEAGFAVDQKYKTPQLSRTCVLVSSNFQIGDLIPTDVGGFEENKAALLRRFWHINIYGLLRLLGLKLRPKSERNDLKKAGNDDMSKLFIAWDYLTDCPTGLPLKDPVDYQEMIRDAYYKN